MATKILESEDIRIRQATVKFFVQVAQRCVELNNFNTAYAIHAAFESSPIHRLKKTWEQFNSEKKNKQLVLEFETMSTLFNPKGNHSNYRKHLHTINPPVPSSFNLPHWLVPKSCLLLIFIFYFFLLLSFLSSFIVAS